jgi:hypothetical protein
MGRYLRIQPRQAMDSREVDAWQRRPDGLGPGGKYQGVMGHLACRAANGEDAWAGQHVPARPEPAGFQSWAFAARSQGASMPWVSVSQTDSSHMALMTAKVAVKPTPSIQVKHHMRMPPVFS